MINSNTPKPSINSRDILPSFLLSGLLAVSSAILLGCSSTEEKPVAVEEPEPIEAVTEAEPAEPKEIRVKASHPRQYTVKKGDTLWDLSLIHISEPTRPAPLSRMPSSA